MTRGRKTYGVGSRAAGFTLLEVLIVIAIMGMLAAMAYPALGMMDDRERARLTVEKMDGIRRAIVGDLDRFDETGLRIIGGYVGDMEAWPDLWEAAPEVRGHVIGVPPAFDPDVATNLDYYLYRPVGYFNGGGVWQWGYSPSSLYLGLNKPFRKLTDDTTHNNDHIGGLETENEGQPRGLWTEDVDSDGTADLGNDRWKGPYLVPPTDDRPADVNPYATDDSMYEMLEPTYHILTSTETWEDGDYGSVSGERGEHRDDKEDFRLSQNNDRLADGWHHSFRFFITADPDHAGGTIFWVVSEGPDGEGTYPAKGTHDGSAWISPPDPDDRMGYKYDPEAPDPKGYNPDDEYNQDNIVMKIYSHEWQAVIDALNLRKRQQTEEHFAAIRRALIGNSTAAEAGFNSGFTGALCRWPALFRWEENGTPANPGDDFWDDKNEDATPVAYTKGQPRGLWTRTPNSADPNDNLSSPSFGSPGIGWSGAFLPAPMGNGADAKLMDAWGREVLFFQDDGADNILYTTDDSLLVLSRGPDGRFDFGDTDTLPAGAPDGTPDYLEPGSLVQAVEVTTYTSADTNGYNADNVVMIVRGADWVPARLSLDLTVLNATPNTRAKVVYGWDGAAPQSVYRRPSGALTDEDGDGGVDDWHVDTNTQPPPPPPPTVPAFFFDATTSEKAVSGARMLVLWEDTHADDVLATGEQYAMVPITSIHVYKDTVVTLRIDKNATLYTAFP